MQLLSNALRAAGILATLTVGSSHRASAAELPQGKASPIAHWTFDEPGSSETIAESSGDASLGARAGRAIVRRRGVHGGALELSGENRLAVDMRCLAPQLAAVTFSAWVRPTELQGYREIFRQECDDRLLFSFQNSGTILSLGLNVGGYVECDAPIRPEQVLDGRWHHCAASFDGRTMRVFLDGQQIGTLDRAGPLATQPNVRAFIGSSSGRGEFFQGGLDDFRIYACALTLEQIRALHRRGLDAVAELAREMEEILDEFYVPRKSFAETLAQSRKNLLAKGLQIDPAIAGAMAARIQAAFPREHGRFVTATGTTPLDYLIAKHHDFHTRHVGRLVELMLEYKPLTDCQIARMTPSETAKLQNADRIRQRFDAMLAEGSGSECSPEWLEILLAAAEFVQFRPSVSEAVAPYVTPQTPLTRDLTVEEARESLERDWLHQAGANPTPQRIRDEIAWTRVLAERIRARSDAPPDFHLELSKLAEVERRNNESSEFDRDLYFRVRAAKRAILFRNPVIDFDRVLFVDMPFPQGSEWRHQTRHRLGYMAVPGGRLLVLEGLSPGGKLRQLMPQSPLHGSFWRPDLSFDGRKVLFCFKPHNEKSFHLYEINTDGTGLVQLTDGPYDDLDPVYLPDGEHIAFSTTRGHTYVRCMPPTNAFPLARCDRDGKNVYLMSINNEPDYLPSVLSDGRLIYTRWEYTDKPLWRAQALWTMNPDGTQVSTFWGNQSVWPDLLKDAREIPGSQRVMFVGSAHHDWFAGSVGIIDPAKGFNFPWGITKVTADVAWPESGNGPTDPIESPSYHASGQYAAYYSPLPLSEQDFLVSANRNGKFVLYLMDIVGNRELIYEGTHHILHALPLRPRLRPAVIPDRVAWPTREDRLHPRPGLIFSNNVYDGAPPELAGKARYLRILNIDPKTYTYWHKRPYISTGPVVSMVQSEGVKRILGTVPIERDGSVAFTAPAGTALHFQLLDENHRALQTMRSFTGVMPGESRGCQGCHELHSRAPQPSPRATMAFAREPSEITPPPWDDTTVSFARYVQPVLDKYCGKCHQGDGEARRTLDLSRRPGFLMFDEPYVTLIGKPTWGTPYVKPADPPPGFGIAGMLMVEAFDQRDPRAYATPSPMTSLSYKSRLVEIATSGKHYDVRVDPVSAQRLIVWVDAMAPYHGEEEVREIDDPDFQGVDWLAIRPRIKTAPIVIRPGPVD